jgi:hypothetical protein
VLSNQETQLHLPRIHPYQPPERFLDLPSQFDEHEQQRRILMDDAYSRASQKGDEEEEDMEGVMEDLEELSRLMAQFKELNKKQAERFERFVCACVLKLIGTRCMCMTITGWMCILMLAGGTKM